MEYEASLDTLKNVKDDWKEFCEVPVEPKYIKVKKPTSNPPTLKSLVTSIPHEYKYEYDYYPFIEMTNAIKIIFTICGLIAFFSLFWMLDNLIAGLITLGVAILPVLEFFFFVYLERYSLV